VSLREPALDDAVQIRRAGRDLLSLALIEARNLTLRWLEVYERRGLDADNQGGALAPRWLAGRAGWMQERWIGRHVQRSRGDRADPLAPPLASAEPRADVWFAGNGHAAGPDAQAVRGYLAQTMETTLELLAGSGESDDELHFYRAALAYEDRIGERLAERAAMLRLATAPDPPPPWRRMPSRAEREPIWLPAQRLMLGSPRGGYVPDNERWAHEQSVPECEIDALPVSWARYIEFVDDGGYDRAELWAEAGWAWAQAQGRRAPRDVEQLRGGVLVHREGQLQRAAAAQPVLHVTRHEAEAWCRWAGRRLPTEPEWELAARTAASRGFVWGDVFEWVAGSARPWPGYARTPGSPDPMPEPGSHGVLRGASWMTPPRARHAAARRFVAAEADAPFCGFRSCAP